jgi:hypothetical protein
VNLDAQGGLLVTLPMVRPQPGGLTAIGLQVWAVDLERRMRRACAATGADLTARQWKQFIGDYTGEDQRPGCAPALQPDVR